MSSMDFQPPDATAARSAIAGGMMAGEAPDLDAVSTAYSAGYAAAERDLAQARTEAAKYRAALEHVIEHLDMRDDAEYIERLARAALEQI